MTIRILDDLARLRSRLVGCVPDDFVFAFNVSPTQFHERGLSALVESTFSSDAPIAGCLELELVEATLLGHPPSLRSQLDALRAAGIRIAIADFGTGVSSLAILRRYPIDRLKVARPFIDDVPDDADSVAIADTNLAMARHLGFDTVAEGVETEQQLAFLAERGCGAYQGHLAAPALHPDAIVEFVAEHNDQST